MTRRAADFYPTPYRCAVGLTGLLRIGPTDRVLEPSCGAGAWLHAVHQVHQVTADAVELHPHRYQTFDMVQGDMWPTSTPGLATAPVGNLHVGDFAEYRPARLYDWVVGNPPYLFAQDHVEHALRCVRIGGGVAMLLRSGFLHTKGRIDFHRKYPPWRVYRLAERPKFDAEYEGTGGHEYAFIVWRRGWQARTVEHPVSWKNTAVYLDDARRILAHDWIQFDHPVARQQVAALEDRPGLLEDLAWTTARTVAERHGVTRSTAGRMRKALGYPSAKVMRATVQRVKPLAHTSMADLGRFARAVQA